MSESQSEWNGADQYFYQFYLMQSAYHQHMAMRPPNVSAAYAVLSQIYDNAAFAFSKADRKRLEEQFEVIRNRLYKEDYTKYGFLPSFARKALEEKQLAIDELKALQRDLFDCLHAKKMLIPFSNGKASVYGYGKIKAGGVMD